MTVRTGKEWVSLEAATAADMNKAPRGWIGYAENSADQTSISSTTDITNATVTVTVGTARLLKISGQCHVTAVGGTATYYVSILREGVAIGRVGRETLVPSGDVKLISGWCYYAEATPGSYTYKLAATLAGGGATSLTVDGGAGARAQIIVEDCGSTT